MLQECSTEVAPWYVIPSDDKAYRNWAIGRILHETLTEMNPQYPQPDLDLDRAARPPATTALTLAAGLARGR